MRAVLVVAAAVGDDLTLLLIGSAALGAANAAIFLTRYAAVDLGGETRPGRALGVVFAATALGAVVSPNLWDPVATWRRRWISLACRASTSSLSRRSSSPGSCSRLSPAARCGSAWSSRSGEASCGRAYRARGWRCSFSGTNLVMVAIMAIA